MSARDTFARHRKAAELDRIRPDGHAVIEASAGTGKTYLVENLVVDRLLTGDAGIDGILVVTFTDKATVDLKRRIRAKIAELLAPRADGEGARADEPHWVIDGAGRARLARALAAFDSAAIFTIHGFCHRVLSESAFASHRLFVQTQVDERTAFAAAWKDVLRRELARSEDHRPYLEACLAAGKGVDAIERMLFDCTRARAPLGLAYHPEGIQAAAKAFAAFGARRHQIAGALVALKVLKQTATAINTRLVTLFAACEGPPPTPALLAVLDELDPFTYLRDKIPQSGLPDGFRSAFDALDAVLVPLPAAVADRFLPPVLERLAQRKREAGLFDFQDMLSIVAEAIDRPEGAALVEALRRRYRCAIIDEFQDTDDLQWKIFQAIFHHGDGRTALCVVGDPKQAIYGFRGADVRTYLGARDRIRDAGGAVLALDRSYRATEPMVAACNELLSQAADEPFFDPPIRYDHPVSCGRPERIAVDADGNVASPIRLLSLVSQGAEPKVAEVKRALRTRIAREITSLRKGALRIGERHDLRPVEARDIFVLTRDRFEAAEVGSALRDAGVPHAHYKERGLFKTDEAREIRDVLAAVDDPRDRSRRFRAWITPFFGLGLGDLANAAELPADHPLVERLLGWKALADAKRYEALFSRMLEESGVTRREIFLGDSERSLTNYQHLLELLLEEASRSRGTLRDLVLLLNGYIEGTRVPPGEEPDLQRLESDRDAVQIMSMHMAKGLEASVVFLYGGFSDRPKRRWEPRTWHEGDRRLVHPGKPRDRAIETAVRQEAIEEDQRLLYVALTRARARIYLPYFPSVTEIDLMAEPGEQRDFDTFKRLYGCYRHLNKRLLAVVGRLETTPALQPLFSLEQVVCRGPHPTSPSRLGEEARIPPPTSPSSPLPTLRSGGGGVGEEAPLRSWQPPAALLADDDRAAEFEALARKHAGFVVTSYTRMKAEKGGYHPPAAEPDDLATEPVVAPAAILVEDDLPGGTASGIFLHDVLERIPLESVQAAPSLPEWAARADVRDIFQASLRRHDRDARYLGHSQRLVHTALTAPMRLGGASIAGLCSASRTVRELEFIYPYPEAAHPRLSAALPDARERRPWTIERGFIKGFVDLVFEHEGLVYFADWKSDTLPSWAAGDVAEHVRRNYRLQARLYSLALVKALGVHDAAAYDARFGGLAYCFLRGMRPDAEGTAGVHFERPTWADILAWEADLVRA